MTSILVNDSEILCEGIIEDLGDRLACKGVEYLKSVYPNCQVREVSVPSGFTPNKYAWSVSVLVALPAPLPTVEQYETAVQDLLETTAQLHGYDSIISACTYAGAPNQWQAEGAKFLAWRGDVWTKCHSVMAQVQAGTLAQPTEAALIAMMPVLPA